MYFYWKRASDLTFFSISAFKGNFLWKDHLRRSQGMILKAKTRTQIQYIYNFQVWPLQVKQSMVDFTGAGDYPLSCQDDIHQWKCTSDVQNIMHCDIFDMILWQILYIVTLWQISYIVTLWQCDPPPRPIAPRPQRSRSWCWLCLGPCPSHM